MNRVVRRLLLALKSAYQLGIPRVFWYAVYQAGLHSGFFRASSPSGSYPALAIRLKSPFHPPERVRVSALLEMQPGLLEELIAEADEIAAGQVRLFGGPPVALNLRPAGTNLHWTVCENQPAAAGVEDLKFIWEPARFGWVYPLGRAYLLTADERYPEVFWTRLEEFCRANPPNSGPNWSSAQEVALRLLALLFAAGVFEPSRHTTSARQAQLAGVVAAHARRIPLTLSYARAQNNNHLVVEALGLYAAGCALPDHPRAGYWKRLGWRWLNRSLQEQIQPDGGYTQHSMNYHRLMLHAALQAMLFGQLLPGLTEKRLAAAAAWLLAQVDPASGRAPNLGSNDGASILPLSAGGFADYRPVAQAAARAFLGQPALPPGPWDELGLWLGQEFSAGQPVHAHPSPPSVHRLGDAVSWGTLRAVRFTERPAHADQLHVDLWCKGENIALDAGTFRYTAAPPWRNSLAETAVHNTVSVDCQDQMLRAGRFLWLDWAQADLLASPPGTITAQHYGYTRLGVLHRRELKRAAPGQWQVTDDLVQFQADHPRSMPGLPHIFTLHWLLPDWPWGLAGTTLSLVHPAGGKIRLSVSALPAGTGASNSAVLTLSRAGKALSGENPVLPILGWYSPTYNQCIPALSLTLSTQSVLPVRFMSAWTLKE